MRKIRGILYSIRQRFYFRLNGKKLFYLIDDALKENNIFYWLDFGTLLGAVREHGFIKGDYDMDLSIFYKDHIYVKEALESKGIKMLLYSFIEGRNAVFHKYKYKGIVFDIFFYELNDERDTLTGYSFYSIKNNSPKNKKQIRGVKKLSMPYSGFKEILFLGKTVSIPSDYKQYLSNIYGENYMTPDPKFSHIKNPNRENFIKQYNPDEITGVTRII